MKRLIIVAAYAAAVLAYLAVGWIAGVLVLGAALVSTVRIFQRTAAEFAPAVVCPRGHTVPTFGTVRCGSCGWVAEGSIWRCSNCDATFGHTLCPVCGLSVRNPSL